jgi:hypothetical protein
MQRGAYEHDGMNEWKENVFKKLLTIQFNI